MALDIPSFYWWRAMAEPVMTGGGFGQVGAQMQQQGGQPFGNMTPEQAMAMMQSPEMRQTLARFGLSPLAGSQVRQSPFFNQQFMQQHPMLGGLGTNVLANLAATPAAKPVQGFGAGMQQMAQGLAGGPEMLRQYRTGQIVAPAQMMGMMMPAYGAGVYQQQMQAVINAMQKASEQAGTKLQQQEVSGFPAYNAAMLDMVRKYGAQWQSNPQAVSEFQNEIKQYAPMVPGVMSAGVRAKGALDVEGLRAKSAENVANVRAAAQKQVAALRTGASRGQSLQKSKAGIEQWKANQYNKLNKDVQSQMNAWQKANPGYSPQDLANEQFLLNGYRESVAGEIETGASDQFQQLGVATHPLINPAAAQQRRTAAPKAKPKQQTPNVLDFSQLPR